MRCLILGGTGFLGKNLIRGLMKEHHEVVVYARNYHKLHELDSYFKTIEVICGDFSREADFESILDGIECVFFLISATGPSNKDLKLDFKQNVMPSFALLDCCVKKKIRVLFFSSGGTVYGEPQYLPIKPSDESNLCLRYVQDGRGENVGILPRYVWTGLSNFTYIESIRSRSRPEPQARCDCRFSCSCACRKGN